jgi:hypothetical protein
MNGYLAGCYLKTVFPSRRTGRRRARQIRGEGGPRLDDYRCRYCLGVHLGHPPGQATYLRTGHHGPIPVQEFAA